MSKERNGVKLSSVYRAQIIASVALCASVVMGLFSEPTESSLIDTLFTIVACVYIIKGAERSDKYHGKNK